MPAVPLPLLRLTGLSSLLLCVCAPAETLTVTVLDEQSGTPVPGAVVTLPGAGEPSPGTYRIAQQDRAFQPRVLTVPAGSEVNFPNKDDTQHHVYSFSEAKTFDIELYAGEPESPIRFDQPGIVELGCNIHDRMQGFVIVTDRPYYGRTDETGRIHFKRSAAPQGQPITARVWHPRLRNKTRFREAAFSGAATEIHLALPPKPNTSDKLDQLQQEFNDL